MAVRKKSPILAPCLHEEGHPASQINISKLLYKKKVEPLEQANSTQASALSSWASLSVYVEKSWPI